MWLLRLSVAQSLGCDPELQETGPVALQSVSLSVFVSVLMVSLSLFLCPLRSHLGLDKFLGSWNTPQGWVHLFQWHPLWHHSLVLPRVFACVPWEQKVLCVGSLCTV